MTPAERLALVTKIHASPVQVVLAVTGGGHAVLTDLLGVAGASATLLEAIVPYSPASLAQLTDGFGSNPDSGSSPPAVSSAMASAMGRACAARASTLALGKAPVWGVACTATIATNREKRGEHHGYLCIVDGDGIELVNEHMLLEKGLRTRTEEDRILADVILQRLATTIA